MSTRELSSKPLLAPLQLDNEDLENNTNQDEATMSPTASANLPRRRTLINLQMRRIALGVRKIFSKNSLEPGATTLSPSSSFSGLPPTSPARRNTNRFRLQRTKSNTALTTERDIFPPISDMWKQKTFDGLPCAKDIPRLVRRVIVVLGPENEEKIVFSTPSALKDVDTSLKRSLELTLELIYQLTKHLEGDEKSQQVKLLMDPIVEVCTDQSDAEQVVKQLVSFLGEEKDSQTVRILKTINQDLVAHCTCELHEHITSRFMTKDVRTPEGWRILIKIETDKGVQVSHTRREQSIDVGGDVKNHWEFEWELRLNLDYQCDEMKQAQLRVTDLFLSETIDAKLEAEIKHDLRVGENII